MAAKWWFFILIISSMFISTLLCGRAFLSLIHSFIHSCIRLYQHVLVDFCLMQQVVTHYYHYLFCCSNCSWVGDPSSWHFCPLIMFPSFTEHVLTFRHKILQAQLLLILSQPWNQSVHQGTIYFLVEDDIQKSRLEPTVCSLLREYHYM